MNVFRIFSGAAAAAIAAVSCSVENLEYGGTYDSSARRIVAEVQDFGTGQAGTAGPDTISDIHAVVFRNGRLDGVYHDLEGRDGSYSLKVDNMSGRLYMLANTGSFLDLHQIAGSGISEDDWLASVAPSSEGRPYGFMTGMVELEIIGQDRYVIPVSLRRGVARFDLEIVSQDILQVDRIVFTNVKEDTYLFPGGTVSSPDNAVSGDYEVHQEEPVTGSRKGIAYIYEQNNPDIGVRVHLTYGGKSYVREAALPEQIRRNTAYSIVVMKDAVSMDLTVSVEEWNDGGDIGMVPDLTTPVRVMPGLDLPEGVFVSEDGRVVTLPYTGTDFLMGLDCPYELEMVTEPDMPFDVELLSTAEGENVLRISKDRWNLGGPGGEMSLKFRKKGLGLSFSYDIITVVLEENPTGISGMMDFTGSTEFDFGRYVDNELGILTLPPHKELTVEYEDGEDEWIALDFSGDGSGTVRVLGGWRPNDRTANGRQQSAVLVIRNRADGSEREEYTVSRRNWGLPVTKVNGIWWCKYNAMGNSKDFADQVLSSEDPAALAGKTLFDYLRDCTPEEYFRLWKWEYQGKSGQGLQVIDSEGVAKLDGYVHGQSLHMNTLDPRELAPDGYEVPSYEDFGRIMNSTSGYVWLMWDGSHTNDWGGGSTMQRRNRRRNDVSVGSVALTDLIYIAMYNQADQTYEPVVWYGPGAQWDNSGIRHSNHYNAMLFTCYSPAKKGWFFTGAMNAYYIVTNGAGNNDTRILRFRKSDVEYIY